MTKRSPLLATASLDGEATVPESLEMDLPAETADDATDERQGPANNSSQANPKRRSKRETKKCLGTGPSLTKALEWFAQIEFSNKTDLMCCYDITRENALTLLKKGGYGVSRGQQNTYAKNLLRLCLEKPDNIWADTYNDSCGDHSKMQREGHFGQLAEALYEEFPDLYADLNQPQVPIYRPRFDSFSQNNFWEFDLGVGQGNVAFLKGTFREVSGDFSGDIIVAKVGRVFIKCDFETSFVGYSNQILKNDLGLEYLLRGDSPVPGKKWTLAPIENTSSLDGTLNMELGKFDVSPNQADFVEITTKTGNLDVTSNARGRLEGAERAAAFRQFLVNRIIPLKEHSPLLLFRASFQS